MKHYFSNDVKFESSSSCDNWTGGAASLYGVVYAYDIKHFKEPSIYGINKGRISKLCLTKANVPVVNENETIAYDRWWCRHWKNATRPTQAVYRAILKKYN